MIWTTSAVSAPGVNDSTGVVITRSTAADADGECLVRQYWRRGSGGIRSLIRSASVTIPTNRPSSSTTGRAVKPWVDISWAASARVVDVRTVTTGWVIT